MEKFLGIVCRQNLSKFAPSTFIPDTTTVWSFPDRGDRATHVGNYRGNWSQYIPRNLILRYTAPGDLVLDQMAGWVITIDMTTNLRSSAVFFPKYCIFSGSFGGASSWDGAPLGWT